MKNSSLSEPTLEQWIELAKHLHSDECELSDWVRETERDQKKLAVRQLTEVADLPAFGWLNRQHGYKESVSVFQKRVSDDPRDLICFLVRVSFYLQLLFRSRTDPALLTGPKAEVRLKAIATAKKLRDFVVIQRAGFENQGENTRLVGILDQFMADNKRLSVTPRKRTDKTTAARTFVIRLSAAMLDRFRSAPPSVIKPLGGVIGYEVDDRLWTTYIAKGREYYAEQRTKKIVDRLRSHPSGATTTPLSLLAGKG